MSDRLRELEDRWRTGAAFVQARIKALRDTGNDALADIMQAEADRQVKNADELSAVLAERVEGEKVGNYYGAHLQANLENGSLVVRIGVQTLAHAVSYADWANEYDDKASDYFRSFAITDAQQFASDVRYEMLREREDGSSPLTDFLDKVSKAAIEDGSTGVDEARIKHGEADPRETWATEATRRRPESRAQVLRATGRAAVRAE